MRLTASLDKLNSVEGRAFIEGAEVQALLKQTDMETLLQALVPYAAQLALPYISGFYVG